MACTRTTRLKVAQDLYVSEVDPEQHFTNKAYLRMNGDAGSRRYVYMKFDIDQSKFRDATIISATLRLHAPSALASQQLATRRVTQKWAVQRCVSWNTRPATTAVGEETDTVSGATVNLDISVIFATWVTDLKAAYGVRIATNQTTTQTIYACEARPMYRPELIVVWS